MFSSFFKLSKYRKAFKSGVLIGLMLILGTVKAPLFAAQNNTELSTFQQVNVSFPNDEINLSGNLFLPVSGGNFPAVVILHGSGPDAGLEYKVYAEAFAKAGIAALVYDKRGSGKSGGDWRYRTIENLAGDALAGVRFLQTRSEINSQKVGFWAISQGGWPAVYAAARSKEIAFVVSISSGNGVSPTQQEMFHKDEMFKALGYSERARSSSLKFWRLAFDWLTLVAENKFPFPNNVMEGEVAPGRLGLNYDPIPDWEQVKQPVLLIYGEKDRLGPVNEYIARIKPALTRGGNQDFTFKIFPDASHTITTNKTGLEFDWDSDFAPGYLQLTTDWILSRTDKAVVKPEPNTPDEIVSSKDFTDPGRYGKLPWYGQAYPQLLSLILFPFIFLFGLIVFLFGFLQRKRVQSDTAVRLQYLLASVCLVNLLLLGDFYLFLATSVFPQGMSLMPSYSIPVWQRVLPLVGILSLILTVLSILQTALARREITKFRVSMLLAALVFIPWLYYWNLIGFVFF